MFCFLSPTTLCLSCSQVAGIKGVFLSNKVVENQVKTYITYNKGRDWHLLQAPTTDLQGNKVYCEKVSRPLTRHTVDGSIFGLSIICSKNNTTLDHAMVWSKSPIKCLSHQNNSQYVSNRKDLSNKIMSKCPAYRCCLKSTSAFFYIQHVHNLFCLVNI